MASLPGEPEVVQKIKTAKGQWEIKAAQSLMLANPKPELTQCLYQKTHASLSPGPMTQTDCLKMDTGSCHQAHIQTLYRDSTYTTCHEADTTAEGSERSCRPTSASAK